MSLPFGGQIVGKRVGQQALEGRHEIGSNNLVVLDVDAPEDGLVQVASTQVVQLEVVLVGTREETADRVELVAETVLSHLLSAESLLVSGALRRDTGLFAVKILEIDGIGVVRLQQLAALIGKQRQVLLGLGSLRDAIRQHLLEVLDHKLADLADMRLGDRVRRPVVFDEGLDRGDLDGTKGAAVPIGLSTEAVEVFVLIAATAAGLLERQHLTALTAGNSALQVVAVDPGLGAARHPGGADRLDGGEEFFSDKGLVTTGVLDTFERDHADVVPIAQDRVDLRDGERAGWSLRRSHPSDAQTGEFVSQHRCRPLAGGVALEHPLDPVSTVGIDFDGAHLAALVVALSGVEVAERCPARSTATLGLLQHALLSFGCEVAAVELGDRAHDPVQQHAARCLIDVLGYADELSASRLKFQIDLDVVHPIAR